MDDNRKKLYDALSGEYDMGTYDQFCKDIQDSGKRKRLYDATSKEYDYGTYDSFSRQLGFDESTTASHSQMPAQKPQKAVQKPRKTVGTRMTEAERQNMLNGISGMVAQSKAGLQRTKNRMNYAKANTGLRVPGVTLGVKGGGVHLGQNSKVVETKPQYNAESGKVERSYLTESGNEYKERGGADLEQNAIDEARFQSEQQEAYLLREKQRIEQEMNQRGRELDAEAVDFSWRDMPRGSGGAIHTYNSSTVNGRFADAKYKSLLAQLNKVNDGLATLAEAKKGKASDQWIDDSSNWASKKGKQLLAFGAGAWRGLAHAVGKVSTWDMGMTDMATNGALYSAAVDADRKGIDNISREDRDLLDITAYTNAIQSENEQYLGRGYKAGQVTGESLPFMIEMMLNPASKLGTTATNKLMREAVKRYGKEAVKKATKKYLAAKIGTRLMGDAVGSMAMAGTTGQGHVTADMLNRLTGDVQFKVDDSGKIVYGGREGAEDSVLKAYMKAFGAQTIENHSEMVGEYFAPFLGKAASLTRKGMDKIGLGKVNKLIDDIGATNAAKMLGDFEKQTKWNGTFGEYAEEVVGNIENAILVGDNTLDTAKGTGVFNADQNIDTFLGVSLMGGFFAGAKTLSYRGPKRQALNEMSDAGKVIDNAIGDNVPIMEKWGGWRNTFLVGTDEEKKAALREVMDNTDLPIKFRMGVLNFVKAAQKYEGIVRAQESKVKDGEQDPVAQSSDESYDNGYDTTEPEAVNDAKNMYDYKRQQMSAMVTDEFLADFDNDPVGTLSQVMGRDDFSEDEKQLALDYVNAKATYDGMIDRVRDDIDSRIEESNATVNSRTNRNDGMIHPATLKLDDRKVYIVDGTINMQDDGSMVDVSNSSESILVRDAETGKLEFMSPSDFLSTDESIDPATEKEAAQQALREQYAQEQSDNIDGVLAFNVGDTYDLADGFGQQCSAQIVADNGDGTVQVAWNGDPNNISTARKDELQSMRDIHNRARINDYEQQRAAQRQEQQAEAAEPQRRTYNLNDEITLRDEEGNPVRGSITAEENEDGEIEVYTEHPINGKQVQLLRRDELDNMLLEQNGEVVENVPSEEDVKPSEASLSPSTPLDEDAASVGNTSSEEGGATLEPASATSEEQHIEEEQHAEPMPMIGEGEDAEPDFASVTPQRAHEYIFNESGLDEEDARDFMTNNLRAAETAVTKIKNNKPKMGTSIAKFNKNKAEWQQKLDEANANLDYWQQVKAERNAVLAERAKAQQEADKKQTEEAQAAEAAYREEMAKKEAEQVALGTNTVSPAIRDKWNATPKVEGAQNEIVLANGEKVAGSYYLVESGAATPSHNSANGFAKSEGFPVDENGGSVNDRDYERDKDAQQITRDIANKYDSRAMQTPVVVSQDGVVLSGNGRTMAGELAAAQGTDAEYNEHLAKYPTQYGFTSEQVKGMQHPRVVFVPDAAMPYTADTFAKFNQQEMKGQSKTEHSVKLGKVVDDETFNRIISLINRFDTLGDFYADFTASREAIGELFKCGAISRPQMAEMVDGDGLSAIGKETLENMLIGKAFESNPDAVREATEFKQMRQTIIQALAEISNNISLGKDYSLESELAEAIDLVYNARKSGFKAGDRVSSYARQQQFDFYGVPSTVADYKNATMLMIADILNDNRSTLLKKYLQLYNTNAKDAANGQLDIFSGTVASKESILNDINELLNYGTEEEQKKAAQEAVEKRKAESVAEAGVIDNGSEGSNEDNDRIEETPAEQAPTEEEGSKPVMSHDEKMAFMRQFLEDTAGDMRLLDVVTDEEVQKLIDLYDAWEVVNDGLGAAHDANDSLLNDKNKAIAQKAKENIETAENAANAAFAPVEDYYNELLNTHNIEDEEGDADETETPSAETPLSDAISAAEAETDQNPTDGQKEAGNYKKGHVQVGTFDITIENPKGSVRRGKDANGKEWESKMNNTYGYFRGTEGVDGDHIDVFLSNDIDGWDGRKVFVVDQYNPDGSFDEHKVMLGFNDADDAKSDYLANYEKGWENGRRIDVSAVNLEDFEKWIASSKRKTKAFSEYKNVKSESADSPKTGAFGTIYTQFKGKPQEAIAFLLEKKEGEAVGALHHKDIGDIDLVWGKEGTAKSDGFGLAKLAKYHPEVLGNLQEILDAMVVVKRTDNRVQLESETHQASVRLTWDSEKKNWLLTAFEKKNSVSDNTTDTVETAEGGKRNDTATPQNTVSDGKDTEKDSSDQENGVKSFKITPKEYTTKRGKKLSMHLVTFESELSKEQMNAAKKLAKDAKGWWSKEDGGFLMRDMESAQKLADSVLDDADAVADAQPVSLTDMKEAVGELEEKAESEKKAQPSKTDEAPKSEPKDSGNKLVTDECYAELKARMRKKLGQLNSGIDPERFAIGTEMALYHIERGARKFTEYAKAMIEDLGDAIRPYLKAFYNGARDLPEVEANGWSEDLTPYDEVRTIDIANFDKPSVDALATAEMVVKEHEAEQQAEETKKQISETRNKNRNETKQQTAADTQAITSEATAIASETESVIRTGEENAINEQVGKIDEALDKVNNQLALLGYYEADEEEKDYNEATGYMRNAERKAVKDAGNLASRLIDDLGLDRFEATHSDKTDKNGNRKTKPLASANIAPVGGDVSVRLPLEKGRELYLTIGLEPRAAKGVEGYDGSNLEVTRIVYRVENPNGTERYGNNKWVAEDITYADLLKGIQYEARDYLPKRNDTTAKKPKASKKVKQEPQIGDLFASLSDNNVDNNEETNVQARSSKEGGDGQQRQQDAQMGGSAGNEAERTNGRGMGGRDSRNTESDGTGSKGLSRLSESKQGVTPAEKKNVNNNHAERGKDYAPKGADARIDANIKAIELMQKLMQEGKQATPAQMKVLRQFSGWGGLGKAFDEKDEWHVNPIARRLKELLGEEAYAQAEMSRNSAYYTPASVIDTMWDIARALGFKGGKVLEGSAGIGNIIGAMPTDMSERSNIQAVEIDETTGNILSLLYPDAKVDVQGFEATRVPNGSVDLAITNVPFVTGLHVNDETGDNDLSKKFRDIHDFCIAKNVRKLREGGIGIFITSNGTLDSSQKLRNWLVNEGNADVIGAFRLNNQTFGGTGATSDIIVIRKRVNGKKSANAIDVSTVSAERAATFEDPKTDKERTVSMDYNKYFIEHPECMAGEMRFGFENKDFYRPTSKALYPVKSKNQNEMLAAWMKTFEGMKEDAVSETTPASSESVYEDLGDDVKEGSLVLDKDDKLCIAQYGKAVPLAVNANKVKGTTKAECFRRYQAIKGALADVLSYQTENESDNGLQPLLDKLNDAFDNFVKTYGHLHKNKNIAFLKNDVDFPTILALEKYSEVGDKNGKKVEKYEKTDIFSQRVVEKEKAPDPKNVKDGIIASIYQYGRIDVPYIADKLGKSEEDVKKDIVEKGLVYENPATMQMEVSYEYLSGNVREKLKQAEEANTDGKYSANVEALRKVIPMDIPSHLIEFTLGSSWVDPKLYTDYIKERTDVDVQLTNVGGTWFMKAPYTSYEKNKAMGVRGQVVQKLILGTDLIEAALQNKTITVSETHTVGYGSSKTKETITDKEATQACSAKIDEIRADFKEWARQKMQNDADMSERIERTYNEQFNNYVPLTISDEFVPEYFGGANHKFKMRPHQAKAIIRGTMQPLLLAHEVGTGKTFTLISTAMEMRRLGTAKKPMIVVQNATVGQFVASAKELYPNAKVLTLEDKDRKEEGRKNFYAKIKYNDWDMIVVPQSVFERIPDSVERQMRFIQDKIDEKMMVLEQMREADSDNDKNPIIHQAEKEIEKSKDEMGALAEALAGKRKQRDGKKEAVAKQNASVKAKEMLDRQTDDVEDFDDMGIDALLVDEAHEYKHLGFATAMQRGVKGIDPSFSKKSQGVYLKTQAVLEKNNGRNVIFATGTPISNTAAEIWTFMRYLMPADAMKEYGIYYFDDFVRNFGNLTQMLEFKTDGKFQEVNRFAGYVNLPELVRIWSSVADTVRTDEAKAVKDNVPDIEGGQAQDIYLPQTRALRSIMKFVKEQLNEYNKMSGKEKKENSHIPLTMYGIAKAAAVDARLVMADAEDDKNSKTNEAVRQTLRSLKETAKYNGTIALFADVYQNKHTGFNLYEDIRKKLIEQGVPAEQVVIIRSDMTIKKKQEIFDKVNRGEIRVIMGSTFTLGTGVNIQERLHTLIHLDAPNRPMDYTQRNGRIARQGNLHKVMGIPIRILRFGVQDSLDVTAYQRLKTKGAIADSIMKGKSMLQNSMEDRSMEEDEDVFGDTVAQLSGSQYAMLKNQAEREVRKYESKKKQWEADQTYVHNAIPRINREIERAEERAATAQQQLDAIAAAFGENATPAIKVGKKTYADINAMSDLFVDLNKKVNETAEEMRKSSGEDMRTRKVDVQIGDVTFTITTTQKKELVNHYGAVDTKISRSITYSCPELGLENEKGGAWFKNAIEDIFENVVSGDSFREELTRNTNLAERMKGELEQVKSREGQPFQYDKELAEAYEHLEEYTELMKKELEEKEQKYAEMDSEVEAATGVTEADEADEDTDDDKRFRDSLPDATAEDKDLRYSLREQTAPKHTKTAYAVFIVKQHEDGSVTLHPKMIADEAVGAPPHTWLNADTGKIKRDKQGEPIQNTRGRVSVRDAKGAPLAWRPGKHLAAYPNASQFAVEGDTKGVRDRLPDNVVFFEVEYAADRDYQLEAWEYGVNGNGKYEHSQAGLPYIPKDGYYIYRTNANPNIPAMIITGAYRVKRALTDEEAKKLNQEAGGDWYDRKSGEPMTAERLKELGLDEAGLQRKAETFDYNELEPAHDESSIAMSMPGYVRRDLDFTDKNLLKAIKENKQDASYYQSLYEQQKKNERQREQTAFEDGQVLPIELDWRNGGYKVEGLNAIFANKDRLLDAFRTKYESYVATMTSDGNSIEVSPWRSVLAETKKPRRRNGKPTKAEQAKAAFVERQTRRAIDSVNDVARKLGLNVEVKTDTEGLIGRDARAKGWYDTKTGEIAIILPNHTSGQDVMRTILHEGVAHHGLRELFGEDFDTFLENVYNNASKEIREAINRLAAKNDWDFKVATEEYLAGMAEDTNFDRAEYQSWWGKIKFLFLDMLRKAGLVLNKTLTDADLRYILWRSYRNLNDKAENSIIREAEDISKQMDLKVGNFAEETGNSAASVADGDSYMYRDGDVMDERDRAIVRDRYERTIQSGMYQFREAVQDSMLSLRRLMEHIAEATGEKVKDFENAYMAENALSSKNHAEQDIYGKLLFNPMLDEIHNLAKENSSRDEVTRYMMAKHGLERNEVMARRAAEQTAMDELGKDLRAAERAVQNDPLDQDALDALDDVKQRMQDRVDELYNENRERDYGGITGLMGEDDLATAESLAKQFVLTFEGDHDVDQLWGRVNACTKATLEKTYKAGLLSKAGFDEINSMYEYYIPLRGFDATTSDEVYSYLTHEKSGFSSPLKKAEGRKSIADDPIATIANMADCAIVQGNRNMMKQKFLKFAMNHPSDAVSVNKMWLRYDDVQDQWEAVTANIDENDSADDVLAKTEAFEEQMRQLAESDPDHYRRGKDASNIPYIALGKNLNEHQVHVKMGGEDYILTINGSPRVAQALNGLTNPDNENTGAVGAILKMGEYVNRQMSAFYTTRNPEFVLSNFLRDAMYANSTMWVRETPNYAIKFNKNFLKCNPAMLYKLLQKHNSGTLDMNNEMERAFYQFMMNGGETGYTVVKDIEKQKKLIKKYVRMKDASIPAEAAWKFLGDKLDDINRSVENCARFAAYLTSRQMGRSVERSVWDAKEVSVNFNKKGAGSTFLGKTGQTKFGNFGAFTSGIGRSFYVFWNAAVQGTTNFASLHKHHTAKALAMDAGLFLLGAMLAGIGGGDDDDYWNLPSYVRRSNICFKIPGTKSFCSIPLGIEQRAIYGLGELFSSLASGKERMSGKEIAKEIAGSMSSMLPLDLMESDGDMSWSTVSPSYVKPFVENANNKDWKGMPIYRKTPYNEDDPEWTKASKRTNQLVVDVSKWCNEVTGGDDVKRGWANWNPSKLEHLFEGVFGGISTTANKMVKAGEMVAGKQDFDWSNILLASRVIKSGDENAAAKRYNAEYWKYCGEYRETKRLVDHYENQDAEGIIGAAEKLDFMYNSPEYGRYEIVDEYYYDVKELSDELKETTDDQERKELEAEINTLKQEMVMRIRAFDDARKK
jgi:N12 class adenine-specific DNA methylase